MEEDGPINRGHRRELDSELPLTRRPKATASPNSYRRAAIASCVLDIHLLPHHLAKVYAASVGGVGEEVRFWIGFVWRRSVGFKSRSLSPRQHECEQAGVQ